MSGFSADWLALREPIDLAARNQDVENAFLQVLPDGPLRILDLASGAGSTVAAMSPRLSGRAAWLLTDYDQKLLDVASARWSEQVSVRKVDLQADLEQLPLEEVDAVTTSAFLDLVSEPFLQRLAECVTKAGKPFLASLTYDGRSGFEPVHAMDARLLEALNRHQKTDKGFGRSLGPDAAAAAVSLFGECGCRIVQGPSDWQISSGSEDFLQALLSGWLRVGRELDLPDSGLEAWWQDRQARIEAAGLAMTVGHVDFLAVPS